MDKRCIYCQHVSSVVKSEKDCPKCGMANKLTPFVSTPMMQATTFRVFEAFESPATGRVITSESARKRDMKESGCRQWEGIEQEKKYAAKAKAEEMQKEEKQVESWVAETYQNLPLDKKQVLENVQ